MNGPEVAIDNLRGLQRAHLAEPGAVPATVTEAGKGHVSLQSTAAESEISRAATLVAEGYATITPLLAVCEATGVNLPLPASSGFDTSVASTDA